MKGTDTKATAKAWAVATEKDLLKEKQQLIGFIARGLSKDVSTMTVGNLINKYLEAPETKQLKTYADIERLLGWWLAEYNDTKLLNFDDDAMRAGRDKLSREPRSLGNKKSTAKREPGTVNRYISAMRSCWNWGRKTKTIPNERTWAEELMLTESKARVRYLDDTERTALLEAADGDQTMKTAIIVSIACGIRQDELLQLKWKDIGFDRTWLTLHETKNGQRRGVHLPSSAVTALQALKN